MSLKVPPNFDDKHEDLDPNEIFIRDTLGLTISNWAKFRFTIKVGNGASCLRGLSGNVPSEVQECYRELGKSHYEVITSLGCARLSWDIVISTVGTHPLLYKKSVKDFYFHLGCLLDNLARLVYIVNDRQSPTQTNKQRNLLRHWIDWGMLRTQFLKSHPGYARYASSKQLKGIINIRNVIAHSWACPVRRINEIDHWPAAIRTKRDFYWPYDEMNLFKSKYRKWIPIVDMLRKDFAFVEYFQQRIFGRLIKDIKVFEANHNLTIE